VFLGSEGAGALQHRRGHVDAGGVPQIGREGADDDAAAAGDVEHRVVRAGPRGIDDHLQRGLVRDRRGGRERRRLAGELIADQALMRRVGHVGMSPFCEISGGIAARPRA
jgi:hypothetical protein